MPEFSEALGRRIGGAAMACARRSSFDRADLVQEGWLAVLETTHGLNEWPADDELSRIAARAMWRYMSRLSTRAAHYSLGWTLNAFVDPTADEQADLRLDIARATENLTDTKKRFVTQRVFEFRSFEELAASFGISIPTAHKWNQHAYASMRPVLSGGYGSTECRPQANRKSRSVQTPDGRQDQSNRHRPRSYHRPIHPTPRP